jgi:hypothetical protein
MERQQATLDDDNEKLLQERWPRATTTTERGKELTHIPTPHDVRIQQHSKTTRVGTEAQNLDVKYRQPEIPGEDETILPSRQRRETGETMEPQVADKPRRGHQLRRPSDDTRESGLTAGARQPRWPKKINL